MKIEEYIPKGSSATITARELTQITGFDVRTIMSTIQRRRREGIPICAKKKEGPGFFIAINAEELRDYCGRLKHEEAELRKTRRACEKLIDKLPGESED